MAGYGKRKRVTKKSTQRKKFKTASSTKKYVKSRSSASSKPSAKSRSSGSINKSAKKVGTSHWQSYGAGLNNMRKPKALRTTEKMLAPITYNVNAGGTWSAATGLQKAAMVSSVYAPADNNAMWNAVVAGFTTATDGDPVIAPLKIFLKTCTAVTVFTNQTNCNAFLDIYDIVTRKAQPASGTLYTPLAAWELAQFAFNPDATIYGATPFESPAFCYTYKVKRITRVNLAQGESHEHRVVHKTNRIYNNTELLNDVNMPGLTHFTMCVSRGSPADSSIAAVTAALHKIDYITTERYTVQCISGIPPFIATSNTLNTTAVEDVMNPATGASIVVAVA